MRSPAFFFFNDTATTEIYTLSLHDALPILIDVLRSYVAARKFRLHDFVVMPDHRHLLVTVGDGMTVERAMQLVKGGFSYRLKKECGHWGEVWQGGFSETRV